MLVRLDIDCFLGYGNYSSLYQVNAGDIAPPIIPQTPLLFLGSKFNPQTQTI